MRESFAPPDVQANCSAAVAMHLDGSAVVCGCLPVTTLPQLNAHYYSNNEVCVHIETDYTLILALCAAALT